MIRRLLYLNLLIASSQVLGNVKLDPDKIRRYSDNLELEFPGAKAAIIHYQHPPYVLNYLAANHSNNMNSDTLKLVRRLFTKYSFHALIVEPFPRSAGESPKQFLKLAKQGLNGEFILGGEAAFAILQADSKKIPFFGGEPDHRDIYLELKRRGYTDLDVIGFYVVRQIPQWRREKQDKTGLLERNVPKFIHIYCKEFPVHPCPSLRDVRLWYKTKVGKELGVEIANEDLSPIETGKLLTQKIAAAVGDVRDKYTLHVIEALMNNYKQVAVVYGSGHYVTLRKSFDAALGPPSFETQHP